MGSLRKIAKRIPGLRGSRLVREEFPPGHYYSPYPDLDDVARRSERIFTNDRRELGGIDLRDAAQRALLEELARYYDDFDWSAEPSPGRRFHLGQQFFLHTDAFVLQSMLRRNRPSRVIEVGSGFSSALMLDTNDRFLDRSVRFTFIEPYAERLKSLLSDRDREATEILESPVQDVPVDTFRTLGKGDILFIDSSHAAKTGGDVNYLLFEILPVLAEGVIVHVHDVFWPFEYPEPWVMQGRAWNEAYLLRAFLQYNDRFRILLFNAYCHLVFGDWIGERLPRLRENEGGSIWLERS